MRLPNRLLFASASVLALAASISGPASGFAQDYSGNDNTVQLQLTPSSPQLAGCMPNANVQVRVNLTTDKKGSDTFDVSARNIAPNRAYTVFLLEQAATPFGAAEYIGDLNTDGQGNGDAEFQLIVQEAFSSTIVDGKRVRVDLNRVGMWFADPKDDDFCLGDASPTTPFDGDNEAGVQAFNSANADPLPSP